MSLEQVQRVTNQTLNVKYRAELASQDYKAEVDKMNEYLNLMRTDFKPLLRKVQQAEEQRIEYLKTQMDKFGKQFLSLGMCLVDRVTEAQSSISLINYETDMKIFIDEHRSEAKCPDRMEYRPYEHSEEVIKQKAVLIGKINQQKISNNQQQLVQELKKNEIDPIVLQVYLHTLMRGEPISYEEKSSIISSLHNNQTRDILADFLKEVNAPKHLENVDALKTLGEIIKYSLTAFIHERDENYKIVYAILHSSQPLYFLDASGQRLFLTSLLNDHGIWQET